MNSRSDCWDQNRALDGVAGDHEFLSELACIFPAACPALLKSLEDAISAKNCLSVADTAHLLGRAAQDLAASWFTEAPFVLEEIAGRNDLDGIGNARYVLRQGVWGLLDALDEFRKGRSGLPDVYVSVAPAEFPNMSWLAEIRRCGSNRQEKKASRINAVMSG